MTKKILLFISLIFLLNYSPKSDADNAISPQIGQPESQELRTYFKELRRKIRRNWYPPKDFGKSIQVEFSLHHDGHISNLKITHSSGSSIGDQTAIKAITKSVPFAEMPQEIGRASCRERV